MAMVRLLGLLICVVLSLQDQAQGVWRAAELWEDLPGQTYLRVYMFNVTNPAEFLAAPMTVKPRLKEVGPYVYRVQYKKVEASQQFDDQSVRFRQQKHFEFDSQASAPRTEADEFNIVNLQLLIYGTRLASMNSYMDAMYIRWLTEDEGEVMIRKNTMKEIMFDGMESEVYVRFEEYLTGLNDQNAPPGFEEFEDGRYSYFKNKNGSDNGELRLQSSPASGYGGIITLDRQDSVSYWNDSICNGIGGTSPDGSTFSPSGSPSMLFAYLPELCRAVMLNKVHQEYEYGNTGVPGTPYMLGDSFLNYSRDHSCYCTDTGANCLPDGALDIQSCSLGAPYAISQPRFRNADPSYAESVEWVDNGARYEHEGLDQLTYWVVETSTGTVLEANRRFQLNIRVGALKTKTYFKNFPEFLFPLLWMEETYKLDGESLRSLKSALDGGEEPGPDPTTTTTVGTTTTLTSTSTTTTSAPAPTDPGVSTAQFNQLHDDIIHVGRQILFSTLAVIVMLIAILVMNLLTLAVHRRGLARRSASLSPILSQEVPPASVDVDVITKS